jgi:hypothetical protein
MELWLAKFNELEYFIRKNKMYPPVLVSNKKGDIGVWAYHKKKRYLSGHLEPEKRALLETLPNWIEWVTTSSNADKWETMYSYVDDYVKKHGVLPIVDYKKQKMDCTFRCKLRSWVYNNQSIKNKYIDAIYNHDQKKAKELLYKYNKLTKIDGWYFSSSEYFPYFKLTDLNSRDQIREVLDDHEFELYTKLVISAKAGIADQYVIYMMKEYNFFLD